MTRIPTTSAAPSRGMGKRSFTRAEARLLFVVAGNDSAHLKNTAGGQGLIGQPVTLALLPPGTPALPLFPPGVDAASLPHLCAGHCRQQARQVQLPEAGAGHRAAHIQVRKRQRERMHALYGFLLNSCLGAVLQDKQAAVVRVQSWCMVLSRKPCAVVGEQMHVAACCSNK